LAQVSVITIPRNSFIATTIVMNLQHADQLQQLKQEQLERPLMTRLREVTDYRDLSEEASTAQG
jgi:hypothetical protein